MSLPYYKRYPRDFIEGTIGMPLELKGAYALVLDLIYMQDGRLPDDVRYISGLLGCSVKRWNTIRSELIERGKIYVCGEFLSNYRADKERETLAKFQQNQTEKGRQSNKNKDIPKATVNPARVKPEPDTEDTSVSSSKTRGRALPDDWEPSQLDLDYALKTGWEMEHVRIEATKFRNYWTNVEGARGRKKNWHRAWQNWVLNSLPGNRGSPPKQESYSEIGARLAREMRNERSENQSDNRVIDFIPAVRTGS